MLEWLGFFTRGWGVPFTAYVIVQVCALLSVRSRARVALCAPMPLMLVVLAHMMWASHSGASLWPVTMLMLAPGALLAVVVIWSTVLVVEARWKGLLALVGACAAVAVMGALGDHGLRILWTGWHGLRVAAGVVAFGVALQAGALSWVGRRTTRSS